MAGLLLRGCGRAAGPAPSCLRRCGEAAALRALGFSEEQARRLRGLQPRLDAQRRREAAAQLLLLGLSAAAALRVLERSPALLRDPAERLRERAAELRRLGLHGGQLERALSRCPQLLTVPRRQLAAAERVLREQCLLTAEQLREVLASSPATLLEEPHRIHRHFQYAYFRMGVRQKEMVKACLFRMPFAELKNRHIFLERRGLYQTPQKGQTQTDNPKLKDILQLPEKDFLASVARSTLEEYEVFKKLLAREEEKEEEEDRDAVDAEEDEDSDSEGSQTARE
ncbi:transcription termination factor 4, mitochondrial [Cuculus canorus]|uniref:transcription termination factor 4, mitochondrial n=1 Tax=Cuculus canorus TaxID=55661 RepID=UPI0023AA691B|nr:transcription termination factor 4, mitochondrial [Cuculus canorus]XP_053929857.1 transcription termination factor 4, mitochondrial [Cuculus canorus]